MKFLLLVVLMTCTVVFADSEKAHLEYLPTKTETLVRIVNDTHTVIKCFIKVGDRRKQWYMIKRDRYTLWMELRRSGWTWGCR